MLNKKRIPLDQFTVHIPNPTNRLTSTCVMVYENGRFNMNCRLAEKFGGKKVTVSFTEDAKHFALKEDNGSDSIFFPKSGSKKLSTVSALLNDSKIIFPAKYEVWYNDEDRVWQGDLLANPTQQLSAKRHSSKKN